MRRILLVSLLSASPLFAASSYWDQRKVEPFSGLFVTTSVMHVGSDSSEVSWEVERDPSISIHTGSTLGLALGLGWRFPSGWELSGSILSLRSDVEARWSVPAYGAGPLTQPGDTSRTGFMFSAVVPLRLCR